jgi:hypothetical protein
MCISSIFLYIVWSILIIVIVIWCTRALISFLFTLNTRLWLYRMHSLTWWGIIELLFSFAHLIVVREHLLFLSLSLYAYVLLLIWLLFSDGRKEKGRRWTSFEYIAVYLYICCSMRDRPTRPKRRVREAKNEHRVAHRCRTTK